MRLFGDDRNWAFGNYALAALVVVVMTMSPGMGWTADPIKVGFVSIFSGRVAALGETGFKGAQMAADEVNAQGGIRKENRASQA